MAVNPLVFLLLSVYPRQTIPEASILELPTGTGKINSKNSLLLLNKGQGKWWPKIKGLLGNVCSTSAQHQWKNHRETRKQTLSHGSNRAYQEVNLSSHPPTQQK